jgi:hypothetical protein
MRVYVSVCVCVCVCTHARLCILVRVPVFMRVGVLCVFVSVTVCVCLHVRMLVAVYDSMHLCQVHDCLNVTVHDNLASRRCTIQLERVPCSFANRSRLQPAELVRFRRQQLQSLPAGHVRDACRRRMRGRGGRHGETILPVFGCVG